MQEQPALLGFTKGEESKLSRAQLSTPSLSPFSADPPSIDRTQCALLNPSLSLSLRGRQLSSSFSSNTHVLHVCTPSWEHMRDVAGVAQQGNQHTYLRRLEQLYPCEHDEARQYRIFSTSNRSIYPGNELYIHTAWDLRTHRLGIPAQEKKKAAENAETSHARTRARTHRFAIDAPAAPAGFAARFANPSPAGFGCENKTHTFTQNTESRKEDT